MEECEKESDVRRKSEFGKIQKNIMKELMIIDNRKYGKI